MSQCYYYWRFELCSDRRGKKSLTDLTYARFSCMVGANSMPQVRLDMHFELPHGMSLAIPSQEPAPCHHNRLPILDLSPKHISSTSQQPTYIIANQSIPTDSHCNCGFLQWPIDASAMFPNLTHSLRSAAHKFSDR